MDRADQKKIINMAFVERQNQPPINLNKETIQMPIKDIIWHHVTLSGEFLNDKNIILDNQIREEKAGFLIYTPFKILNSNKIILINRGWYPLTNSRKDILDIPPIKEIQIIEGQVSQMPSSGISLGKVVTEKLNESSFRLQKMDYEVLSSLISKDLMEYEVKLRKPNFYKIRRKKEMILSDILKSRLKLIGIVLLFVMPVVYAWYLVFFTNYKMHTKGVEHGLLISPIIQVGDFELFEPISHEKYQLIGKWTLVSFVENKCEKACEFQLYELRQIWLALGKDSNKIQRLAIVKDKNLISSEQIKLSQGHLFLKEDKDSKDRLNSRIKSYPAFDNESIYLIDPYGNLMMEYKKGTNPSGIIKDIERLIRISK